MKMLKLAFWMACVFAAQTSAQEGINLSWDDCGSYGVSNKQFACDTNVGADVLVVSFRVNTPLPDFIGAQAILSVRGSSALPDWWKHYAGFAVMPCRDTLGLESDLANTSCPYPYLNPALHSAYAGPSNQPEAARLQGLSGQNPTATLAAGVEFAAVRILITHHKTVGPSPCPGCQEPVCIVLNEVELYQYAGSPPPTRLTTPIERNYVTWQSTLPLCPASTPARSGTWGAIKSMYR